MGCCDQALHQKLMPYESCPQCGFEPLVRNHFFTGKMMGAAEFVTETHYHSEKMRHHHVRLHGWGVACGLKVKQHPSPECRTRYVVVEPGSAIDCCGHEIIVPQEEIVDVAGLPQVKKLAGDQMLHALQLCVRWRECPTENVPVLYDECGCDDTKCAPNRILESFAFDVLVDPVLSLADLVGHPALGAIVATDAHGVLGPVAAASGIVAVVDPSNARRLLVIDPAHRSMKTLDLAADAKAIALAASGLHVFVVTTATGGTQELEARAFALADLAEAGAPRKLAGTSPASKMAAAAGKQGGSAVLVAYDAVSGDLYRWAHDNANVLAANAVQGALAPNLSALASDGDATAYVLQGNSLQKLDLAAAAPALSAVLAFGAVTPVAIAAYTNGAVPMVAIAALDGTTPRLYAVDPANASLNASVVLAHDPQFVAAAGEWLHVYEDAGGHGAIQAVHAPSIGTANPLITASRLTGGGTREIVLLLDDGQAAAIQASMLADSDCADLLWHQLEGCPSCDRPDCVVLATLANYRPGRELVDADTQNFDATKQVRIDNRTGRRMLASTATLQAWLECLQLKGGVPGPAGPAGANGTDGQNGADGKDGVGLYMNLPKILDIGWRFEETRNLTEFATYYVGLTLNLAAGNAAERVRGLVIGGNPPPLTIYFNKAMRGITRRTLAVTIDAPFATENAQNNLESSGLYLPIDLRLYGSIIEINGALMTPHTNEPAPYAVSFVPHPRFFMTTNANNQQLPAWPFILLWLLVYASQQAGLDQPCLRVELKGDFVYAPDLGGNYTELGVLDGDNIGGRVGQPPPPGRLPPLQGGANPSGNLTQGGVFESWFFLGMGDPHPGPANDALRRAPLMTSFGASMLGDAAALPPTANFASANELAAIPGVSRALANRIVRAREAAPLTGLADLKRRANLTEREWQALKDHLIVL
jgi:hypothetical protein